ATWDAPLVNQISTVISTEARAKYNEAVRKNIHSIYYGLTIWSPNINIFRDPRWGRGQETYGEDPFLTAHLGVAFVKGLHGDHPACASKMLLQQILRGDWKFQGFVTSDCGAIDDFFEAKAHHTSPDKDAAAVAGIEAGTDTNCGTTYLALTDAVKKGLITEAQIDVSLKRLFLARYRLGLFDPPEKMLYSKVPFSEVGSPEHAALALKAARESMVLLTNSNNT